MGTREVSKITQEGFDEGVQPKLDRGERGKSMGLQDISEEQAGVNHSYYQILYS